MWLHNHEAKVTEKIEEIRVKLCSWGDIREVEMWGLFTILRPEMFG